MGILLLVCPSCTVYTVHTYTECCPKRVPNKKKPPLAPSLFFHHGFWREGGGRVIPRLLTVTIFCWSNPLQTEITPLWALELLYPRIESQWALKLLPSCILPLECLKCFAWAISFNPFEITIKPMFWFTSCKSAVEAGRLGVWPILYQVIEAISDVWILTYAEALFWFYSRKKHGGG